MKTNNYLIKIKTAAEFVITFCLVYFTVTYPIPFFFSAIMLIIALFVFMQALDNVDTINNFGSKNKSQHDTNNTTTDNTNNTTTDNTNLNDTFNDTIHDSVIDNDTYIDDSFDDDTVVDDDSELPDLYDN